MAKWFKFLPDVLLFKDVINLLKNRAFKKNKNKNKTFKL